MGGVFYNLLTSIELAMDVSAMLVKDLGERVEDDYSNAETLKKLGIIDERLAEGLKKCNGLRTGWCTDTIKWMRNLSSDPWKRSKPFC